MIELLSQNNIDMSGLSNFNYSAYQEVCQQESTQHLIITNMSLECPIIMMVKTLICFYLLFLKQITLHDIELNFN